ncbi:MAG: hypothetical protein AB7L90_19655 [Hyphomicrobiaceae bacterium]
MSVVGSSPGPLIGGEEAVVRRYGRLSCRPILDAVGFWGTVN